MLELFQHGSYLYLYCLLSTICTIDGSVITWMDTKFTTTTTHLQNKEKTVPKFLKIIQAACQAFTMFVPQSKKNNNRPAFQWLEKKTPKVIIGWTTGIVYACMLVCEKEEKNPPEPMF